MSLPFSKTEFLDVFGAYNSAMWPALAVLWIVTAATIALSWSGRRYDRALWGLLAVHWLWSGAIYHWVFFRAINPAAPIFAVLFVIQGILFVWLATSGRVKFIIRASGRGQVALMMIGYALAYPIPGILFGLSYPRLPLFAVPCPTTLLTAGLLLMASSVPRFVSLIPALWTGVGASAAFLLDIHADFALALAGGLLVFNMVRPLKS